MATKKTGWNLQITHDDSKGKSFLPTINFMGPDRIMERKVISGKERVSVTPLFLPRQRKLEGLLRKIHETPVTLMGVSKEKKKIPPNHELFHRVFRVFRVFHHKPSILRYPHGTPLFFGGGNTHMPYEKKTSAMLAIHQSLQGIPELKRYPGELLRLCSFLSLTAP